MSRSLKERTKERIHREVVTEDGIFRVRKLMAADLLEYGGSLSAYAPAPEGAPKTPATLDQQREGLSALDQICCASVVAHRPDDASPWAPCTLILDYAEELPDPLVWIGALDDDARAVIASEVMDLSVSEAAKRKVESFRHGQGGDLAGGSGGEEVRPTPA